MARDVTKNVSWHETTKKCVMEPVNVSWIWHGGWRKKTEKGAKHVRWFCQNQPNWPLRISSTSIVKESKLIPFWSVDCYRHKCHWVWTIEVNLTISFKTIMGHGEVQDQSTRRRQTVSLFLGVLQDYLVFYLYHPRKGWSLFVMNQ